MFVDNNLHFAQLLSCSPESGGFLFTFFGGGSEQLGAGSAFEGGRYLRLEMRDLKSYKEQLKTGKIRPSLLTLNCFILCVKNGIEIR